MGIYRRVEDPSSYILDLAMQVIRTDGGPWAEHNVVCAVCGDRGAILNLNIGVFMPCDTCSQVGWHLRKKRRWRRRARHD